MEIFHVVILAIVQALTEFLPISSSGHLVLLQKLFGMREPQLMLDIMLHVGSLLAIIVYFFRDLMNILFDGLSATGELLQGNRWKDVMYRNPNLKLFIYILIATIPAVLVGVFLNGAIVKAFGSLRFVGFAFLFTAIIVYMTKRNQLGQRNVNDLRFWDAVWIGLAQSVAILPGVSRSGMTISTGLVRGLDRDLAFRFSFIMSIPAILGAFVLECRHLNGIGNGKLLLYCLGALISFILSLFVIRFLSRVILRGNFYLFSFYTLLISIVTIILSFKIS